MFEVYKKGQGATARWVAAGSFIAMGVFGCYALQTKIAEYQWDADHQLNLGIREVRPSLIVAATMFVAVAVMAGMIVNQKRFVDYLINSEAELRKVGWPTRAELKRQTIVVLISMAFFGVLLLLADLFFGFVSQKLYGF